MPSSTAGSSAISRNIFYGKSKTELSAMLTGDSYYNIHPYKNENEIYPIIDDIFKSCI